MIVIELKNTVTLSQSNIHTISEIIIHKSRQIREMSIFRNHQNYAKAEQLATIAKRWPFASFTRLPSRRMEVPKGLIVLRLCIVRPDHRMKCWNIRKRISTGIICVRKRTNFIASMIVSIHPIQTPPMTSTNRSVLQPIKNNKQTQH